METNLEQEDLLIKLRAKLNEDKIKLWEPPYYQVEGTVTDNFKELAGRYSKELSIVLETVQSALQELQSHSIDRSKANAEFKETGVATLRVRATAPGQQPSVVKVQMKLTGIGKELISSVAAEIGVSESRVKLIHSGRVIKPTLSIEEQGLKNGVQIMALVMAETPEEVKKEDTMYMEMKSTRDDAMLLSECVNDLQDDDEEYMKLEDQSGATIELPAAERKSLMVGLTLHQRGSAALKNNDFQLALLLFLEADRLFSECRTGILEKTDNWAVLQLDIAWCYVKIGSLSLAGDAGARLAAAEKAFIKTYGERNQRLIALKGTEANERVLFMRLYLLRGIVAFHQNQRNEARSLLERAELEMNALKVDENSVLTLSELGWSHGQARTGLRATGGDLQRAHQYLEERQAAKVEARRVDRERRIYGVCADGNPVSPTLTTALVEMGYSRKIAIRALRHANNIVSDAVRLIQESPDLLTLDDQSSSESTGSPESDDSVEPDERLVGELTAMGYESDQAKLALKLARNHISRAVDLLVAAGGYLDEMADNPSTSAGGSSSKRRSKSHRKDKKKKAREAALKRLTSVIKTEDDDHLDTSLLEEEELLARYKSLL